MAAIIRPYTNADRPTGRKIYGSDEFARPKLLQEYPRYGEFMADEMSYYLDFEPESLFVAEVNERVVGALLGAVDTYRFERFYQKHIRPRLWSRLISGAYGWPGWVPTLWRTDWAERKDRAPKVDRSIYPAHLHIGILPGYRHQGLGTKLMESYTAYLQSKGIAGFHLYASSFHSLGIAFYNKLGLEILGRFNWRLYTGFEWVDVMETIYGKQLQPNGLLHIRKQDSFYNNK